jgi:hypothetical protein
MAKTGTVSRDNSLELLRTLVEKDPRARSGKILLQFRKTLSDEARSASRRDAQEKVILDLIRMLKAEREGTKSLSNY